MHTTTRQYRIFCDIFKGRKSLVGYSYFISLSRLYRVGELVRTIRAVRATDFIYPRVQNRMIIRNHGKIRWLELCHIVQTFHWSKSSFSSAKLISRFVGFSEGG